MLPHFKFLRFCEKQRHERFAIVEAVEDHFGDVAKAQAGRRVSFACDFGEFVSAVGVDRHAHVHRHDAHAAVHVGHVEQVAPLTLLRRILSSATLGPAATKAGSASSRPTASQRLVFMERLLSRLNRTWASAKRLDLAA